MAKSSAATINCTKTSRLECAILSNLINQFLYVERTNCLKVKMSGGKNSIMLFGVQLTEGTNNTNNSQYQQPLHQVVDATSVADNVIDHASAGTSGTKRGNWTEEEHRNFLEALSQNCKGKWKTISTDFVKTRTPTQVASHAQKHYLPRPNRHGKPSVFDLTIDTDNTNMQHNQLGEMNRQGSLTSSGKRVASGVVVEKTVERRIKNKESAARSRARKQAYTQELERKVLLLEEENETLRKHNEVKSSTITEDEQIRQETVVPLPPPTPTAYPSTLNGGILHNPLSMGLGTVTLSVLPSWVDLNDNGSSSSTETFPLSLKPQSLPLLDNHSSKSNGHSSASDF